MPGPADDIAGEVLDEIFGGGTGQPGGTYPPLYTREEMEALGVNPVTISVYERAAQQYAEEVARSGSGLLPRENPALTNAVAQLRSVEKLIEIYQKPEASKAPDKPSPYYFKDENGNLYVTQPMGAGEYGPPSTQQVFQAPRDPLDDEYKRAQIANLLRQAATAGTSPGTAMQVAWEREKWREQFPWEQQKWREQMENDAADRRQRMQQAGLSYAQQMADTSARTVTQSLPFMVPKGSIENLNSIYGHVAGQLGVPYQPAEPQGFPFDPMQLAQQMGIQALKGISPYAAELAGEPPKARQGFRAPGV